VSFAGTSHSTSPGIERPRPKGVAQRREEQTKVRADHPKKKEDEVSQ